MEGEGSMGWAETGARHARGRGLPCPQLFDGSLANE